jgi:hypothetical protein
VVAASSNSTTHVAVGAELTGDRTEALATLARMPQFGELQLGAIAEGTTDTATRWTRTLDFCSAQPRDFFTTIGC